MAQSSPYQPALLRILHGIASLLVVLALITGFWVYNTYDGRWGRVPLPTLGDIQGIHGTIALTFLLVLPLFALYSLRLGERRLVQESVLNSLTQVGRPAGWVAWQRLANTLMLLAVTLAVLTGRMMKEAWLPAGEVQRPWYLAHLIAWLGVLLSLALHLLMGAKVGGVPLLLSMAKGTVRQGDRPATWWPMVLSALRTRPISALVKGLEIVIMGGILLAFILPVFSS